MRSPVVLPVILLLLGAALGRLGWGLTTLRWSLPFLLLLAWFSWHRRQHAACASAAVTAFLIAGIVLALDARAAALGSELRQVLAPHLDGVELDSLGPIEAHAPMPVRAVLVEDASPAAAVLVLRARIEEVFSTGGWQRAGGHVVVAVSGSAAARRLAQWRAGRTIEAPMTFRRPARYLDAGVPDFEHDLALDGTTLFASVKSGLLVEIVGRGTWIEESAGAIRAAVRDRITRRVGVRDAVSAGIVTAVLTGDRAGLPDAVRERLQAAGTYHVIAISGGNIAILVFVTLTALRAGLVRGRAAAALTLLVLGAHVLVVVASASVWRATAMGAVYLVARVGDFRSAAWHALALAGLIVVCAAPLDVGSAGFILTCAATAALIETGERLGPRSDRPSWTRWLVASAAASVSVELVLAPVNAWTFSRLTGAGLVLNLVAVPLMAGVQVSGLLTVALDGWDAAATVAAAVAHAAAAGIVGTAGLVDIAPWLERQVPRPSVWIVVAYYVSLGAVLAGSRVVRAAGTVALALTTLALLDMVTPPNARPGVLRVTVLDVGQGDATVLQMPDGTALLIDAGGVPFGTGAFDVGARVVTPALRALGVRSLDALVLTHGDPDHAGGAAAVIQAFGPERVWDGVPVPAHAGLQALRELAARAGVRWESVRAGMERRFGDARVRVLHPPAPDWERPRVRNDDSIVLEVRYGGVGFLLTGDIGSEVERGVAAGLDRSPPIRVLKVAHHGSRTSTSADLLSIWRPQVATVSAGRGNTFGHPAPAVLQRLAASGAAVYRTDRSGQIVMETDGTTLRVRTYMGSN